MSDEFPAISTALLRSKNPYLTFARALELFSQPPRYEPGVHPTAVVHPRPRSGTAHTSDPTWSSIRMSKLAGTRYCWPTSSSIAAPGSATISLPMRMRWCGRAARSGNNVLLQNGVVIGADGFGFAKDDSGRWYKIAQPEPVVIEDDVEIQANSCIDRASVEKTRIGRGTKIDNLVQVGHGSHIGEHSLLASQVGLAGSTEIGNNVILTGQVGVVGHCKVGDGAIVTPQSGVAGDIDAGAIVSGAPAVDHKLWLKYSAVLPRLPEIARAIRKLKD